VKPAPWLLLLAAMLGSGCAGKAPVDRGSPAATSRPEAEGRRPGTLSIAIPLVGLRVEDVPVRVHLALRDRERRRGLSGVKRLAPDEGMLFAYKVARVRTFWMKDCLVPLDIAFLDDRHRIFQIATLAAPPPNAVEEDIEEVTSDRPTALVLEMPAGFFSRYGIREGALVRIPRDVPLHLAE